jgi:predicted transcriptional regulator
LEVKMKKVTIRISRNVDAALNAMGERFVKAWKTGQAAGDSLQFESPAALFRVLSPKRWELVERLQSLGPMSVRGLARALERDVKRVHEDVRTLMQVGLIERTEEGAFHVPYEVIHADFDLRAVA